LLTTKDTKNETKIEHFHYDWKNFFTDSAELKQIEKIYYYKNKMLESDPILWNYKVIWYGRRSRDYKCYPENLQEQFTKVIIRSK
jgi:hypothetical protein